MTSGTEQQERDLAAPTAGSTTARLLPDISVLRQLSEPWDALATSVSAAYCSPRWVLPWWDHARSRGAELRAVAVHEEAELVGLAPFSVVRSAAGVTTAHVLGSAGAAFCEPLARPDRQQSVAAAGVDCLGGGRGGADVLSLSRMPGTSPWPQLLQQAWPGPPPALFTVASEPAPFVDFPAAGY